MSLIELQNISFAYNKGNGFNLSQIDLTIEEGKFISIIGPNGSGKSTLLKIISGYLNPDEGKLRLNSKSYNKYGRKEFAREVAFVSQSSFSIFPFSVYEIVMMGRNPYLGFSGFENKSDREKVVESLKKVGIFHLKNKGINEISGGEAQRAFIARALVQEPRIILLDEPNAHLDIKHQIAVFGLLKDLQQSNKVTVVNVSHDLNLAASYSDKIIMLKNGDLLMYDTTDKIFTKENIKEVFEVESEITKSKISNEISIKILPS